MAIQLVRRPGIPDVSFADPVASRAWIREHVRQEVLLSGTIHPKVYLLGADFLETFDLDAMARREAGADLGATFQVLRRRNNVQRCFLMLGADGRDPTGAAKRWAVVFEERDVADGRRWWLGMLEFTTDAHTGLGKPAQWVEPFGETDNPTGLPASLVPIASPPPGARPAVVQDASDQWPLDIKFAFGELPAEVPPPTDAKQMIELAAALGVVNELLSGRLQGTIVVRITGRSWEQFVLTGDMPSPLVEMVRWIANDRLPVADAVAVALIGIRPQDQPPVPGVHLIGEKDGMYVETWAPIEFPDAPDGPKRVPTVHWWAARPVTADHQWIGVASKARLSDGGAIG